MASLTMGELSLYDSHNASILNDLSAGDLIEFPRGAFSHWAVYFGNEQVIHLTGNDNDGGDADVFSGILISGASFSKAKVCIDDFWTVAAGSKARKNNTQDEKWSPLSPVQIVRNALDQLGEVNYNLLYLNCEHFAKWCRYGIAKSNQAEQAITASAAIGFGIGMGLTTVLAAGAIYAFARYFNNEDKKEEEEEEK